MEECLITKKLCSSINQKCKVCKLDDCKEVLRMIDEEERKIEERKLEKLKRRLPLRCRNCCFLEIINIEKQEVRCFYKTKKSCILI